jgi:hypothetical protein
MRAVIVIIFLILSGCEAAKVNRLRQRIMSEEGTVIAINREYGFYTVFWECENQRYRNQPCFGISDHPMREEINLGDTVRISNKVD